MEIQPEEGILNNAATGSSEITTNIATLSQPVPTVSPEVHLEDCNQNRHREEWILGIQGRDMEGSAVRILLPLGTVAHLTS